MDELIRQRGELLIELHRNFDHAQLRIRATANKHRRDVSFEVGDGFLLKLLQYRQHSVARPLCAKPDRRFYGPFEVVERICLVVYELQLSLGARIHDVFHVSYLKPFVEGATTVLVGELPEYIWGSKSVVKSSCILDHCVALHDDQPIDQVLVEGGSGEGLGQPTWEPLASMRRPFPLSLRTRSH